MAYGRNTSDRVAGSRAHELPISAQERLSHLLGYLGFANPIVAACDHNDCPTAFLSTEHNGFGDFGNRAAYCGGRVGTRARWLLKLDDARIDPGIAKELPSAQCSRVLGWRPGEAECAQIGSSPVTSRRDAGL